jgi:hypothetical protein
MGMTRRIGKESEESEDDDDVGGRADELDTSGFSSSGRPELSAQSQSEDLEG